MEGKTRIEELEDALRTIILLTDTSGATFKVDRNKEIQELAKKTLEGTTDDVSYLWQQSCVDGGILDYRTLIDDQQHAEVANKCAAFGYRTALRNLESLGLISMGDIDRKPTELDSEKYEERFGSLESNA